MQMRRKRKQKFALELFIVCLLIGIGMFFIVRAFTQYSRVFLENQDTQLYHLAQAVDRNIANLLERYYTNLNYVTARRGFVEAEKLWRETGETEELSFRLKENLLNQDKMIVTMLAVNQGNVFISTDGKLNYTFPEDMGNEEWKPCIDGKGKIYLAFICDAGDGLEYAALMDLDLFYGNIVGEEFSQYDWVILTDAEGDLLMYQQQGKLKVDQVDAVTSATCGREGVEILLSQQKKQEIGTSSYEYSDWMTEEKYMARMVSLPSSETVNGAFAIGVVTNFEDVIKPLQQASIRLLIYGGMVAVGVLLLIRLAVHFRRRNEKDLEELKILREKNEATEAIVKKTRELAHHQRLETIGTLTSGLAHEFNNLLTPIMGYSILTLEQMSTDNEELYDNVLEIYNASCKARDIIARLSELSRKNNPELSYTKISLDELVEKVLHVAIPACPPNVIVEKKLEFGRNRLKANETQMSQLVLNLVLNGFHAMEDGGGVLSVSAYAKDDMAVLEVKDTGTGIRAETLEHIYDPFFTTKETGKGTGLGLAIVWQIVSEHNGKISVDTEVGKGTVFTVQMPLIE